MVLIELHSDLENVLCIQNYLVKYADLTLKANQTFFLGGGMLFILHVLS